MTRVLCLHGLGGTGATMWPVIAACASAGFTALAPTLPGHGGKPADLVGITWADWIDAARAWEADVVIGQSMGACLALQLAAEQRCAAVVCINPLAPDPDAIDGLEWRQSRGMEWVDVEPSANGEAANREAAIGEVAYERLPIGALIEMAAGVAALDLAAVAQPILIATSVDDDIVDPASSDAIAAAVSGTVRRVRLDHGGHVATLGPDRHLLLEAIISFATDQRR
jgi:esterase/lipase